MVELTIGMATYNDFDGVYFTLQALRLYQDLEDTELLVVDNFGCEYTRELVEGWVNGRYLRATDAVGTAAPRHLVFEEASGEAVLCCDSHVLFEPGVIARLKQYYREQPGCRDLLQGPLVYDDLRNISTHLDPEWRAQMWGTWGTDPRGVDPQSEPFEIPMQGLGAFSCRKSVWPGFNPHFRGFGGEEGYLHEKFRQAGARCLCLPFFRWMHRFGRPAGVPYPLSTEDKLRNYIIGHVELGLDLTAVLAHFMEVLPESSVASLAAETIWGAEAIASRASGARETVRSEDEQPTKLYSAEKLRSANKNDQVDEADPRLGASAVSGSHLLTRRPGVHVAERAIVCYVDDKRDLIQQVLALRLSWLYSQCSDTDLVVMGPAAVLSQLPDDLVKIEQRSVSDDPDWKGYSCANSIISLNGAGAERLDRYTHILRTDVDTFISPAWNEFRPTGFVFGHGGYSNNDDIRLRLSRIAAEYGLKHHGTTSVGSSWYGPTSVVRQACAFSAMILKRLLTHEFAAEEGQWPGWYRGVSALYAGEIAVNHCAPEATYTESLDAFSTSHEPISRFAHIHCWHTDEKFSKHWFMSGRYTQEDASGLDFGTVRDYCMGMSFLSLCDLRQPYAIDEAVKKSIRTEIARTMDPQFEQILVS